MQISESDCKKMKKEKVECIDEWQNLESEKLDEYDTEGLWTLKHKSADKENNVNLI